MRDACFNEFFIDRKLCCHNGIICWCENCIHAIGDECFCCKLNFICCCSGTLYVFDTFFIKIILCFLNRCCGRILSDIIKKSDFLYIRVLCLDQFHNRRSIQIITCSGNVCSRCFQRIYQAGTNRIGNSGKYDRCICSFCCRLHTHCYRCSYTNHQVYIVSLEIGNDLFHNTGICIAIIIRYIKSNTFFFSDLFQTGLNIVYDLIQGSIIYIIADAYFKIICHYRGSHHHTGCYCCCDY